MLLLHAAPSRAADPTVLKVGTLAPRETKWERLVMGALTEVQSRTQGAVKIQLYPGGVLGDERDMIRKIRLGQIDGGGFSSLGAQDIAPETMALETPFLFRSLGEVDRLRPALKKELTRRFADRGFVLLALVDQAGYDLLYSKNRIETLADLRKQKTWVWTGNRIHLATYRALGVDPVALTVPEVLPGLQTGLINVVYGSPLVVVALQWHSQIRSILKIDLRYEPGVIVLSRQAWDRLDERTRIAMREAMSSVESLLISTVRADDEAALNGLKKRGAEIVFPTAEVREEFVQASRWAVPEGLIRERAFNADFYEWVQAELEDLRSGDSKVTIRAALPADTP